MAVNRTTCGREDGCLFKVAALESKYLCISLRYSKLDLGIGAAV